MNAVGVRVLQFSRMNEHHRVCLVLLPILIEVAKGVGMVEKVEKSEGRGGTSGKRGYIMMGGFCGDLVVKERYEIAGGHFFGVAVLAS